MHYNNSYYVTKKRKLNKRKISILLLCILCLGSLTYYHRHRISLWIKGYSLSEQSMLLETDTISVYLEHDKIDTLSLWDAIDNNKHYFEYDRYYQIHPNKTTEEVIDFIDTYYKKYQKNSKQLGYPDTIIWDMFNTVSLEDIAFIQEQKIAYHQVKEFLSIPSYQIEDLPLYIENRITYPNPITNVMLTSYPAIDASVPSDRTYRSKDPSNRLLIVKEGFVLTKDYQPKDLVTPNIPIAPDCTSPQLRKDAALALEEMYQAAKKEGYFLAINSAYRSYQEQQEVYDQYFSIYDPITAAGLVAKPGSSEHQTGLGVDITSQSVIDGERLVFGDTKEKDWLFSNAYKYGFIVRYPEEAEEITGTSYEPWHYRYVGKEVAKEIQEQDWTLEEYILEYGFPYSLIKQ